jgi:F-type H+-transporting ATPase subunit gamma
MASTRDLKRRIKSIKNTSQITKAMQMVAASKMRRAQLSALAGRPYVHLMNGVLAELVHSAGDFEHPLMKAREVRKRAVIVISSDKGLCGALNSNLLREAGRFDKDSTAYVTAGRKASQFVARTKRRLAAEFTYKDAPLFSEARAISRFAQNLFLSGDVDAVDVLYTNFITTLNQSPEARPFLPLTEITAFEAGINGDTRGADMQTFKQSLEFQFEPHVDTVFSALLPHYLNYQLYQFLMEAKASEHSARMVAMKNATDNAKQIIKDLTLEYNKLRQANITNELLEITTAQMALGN